MEQRSQQPPSDNHAQKVAELERKLQQANQVIANLQKQNLELIRHFQNSQVTTSKNATVNTQVSSFDYQTENNTETNLEIDTTGVKSRPKIIKRKRVKVKKKLSHLHFYGLISGVILLIIGLFGISSLIARQNQPKKLNHNSENSKINSNPNPILLSPAANSPTLPPTTSNPPVTTTTVNTPTVPEIISQPTVVSDAINSTPIYNLTTPPNFKSDAQLQAIVNDLVKTVKSSNLDTNKLSITLIDLNRNTIAGYEQETPRYPASVAKLFWLVILQSKIHNASLRLDENLQADIQEMIIKSDNDAASKIVDRLTNAPSQGKLTKDEYQKWKKKRDSLNTFFRQAGYTRININQKTFPIVYHYGKTITEPQGSDAQIRGDNPQQPIRNQVTSFATARLMSEIATNQAISSSASEVMKGLLNRDLKYWQKQPFNPEEFHPVKNFIGEPLPTDKVNFFSKAGWTTNSRQEVAYVETQDGKTRYVIAIFGDDKGYAKSQDIFPKLSYMVFQRMIK